MSENLQFTTLESTQESDLDIALRTLIVLIGNSKGEQKMKYQDAMDKLGNVFLKALDDTVFSKKE